MLRTDGHLRRTDHREKLHPSTHQCATPHPIKTLLKLRTSTDSSKSDHDRSSSITKCKHDYPYCDGDEDLDQFGACLNHECLTKFHKNILGSYLDQKVLVFHRMQRCCDCVKTLGKQNFILPGLS